MAVKDEGPRKPLRLWPGVALAAIQVVALQLPRIEPDLALYAILTGMLCGPLILLWWLFFSRAAWTERLGAAGLLLLAMWLTPRWLHVSVARGNMGFQFIGHSIPAVSLAFVVAVVVGQRLGTGARRALMAAAIVLGCGYLTLLRSEGLDGAGDAQFEWRWKPTAEERLLAQGDEPVVPLPPQPDVAVDAAEPLVADDVAAPVEPSVAPTLAPETGSADPGSTPDADAVAGVAVPTAPSASVVPTPGTDWPGLRGPNRDGVVPGVALRTDWQQAPPRELWRRAVGPGVSSFAVEGDLFYTQEQRGEEEIVACYRVSTGEPVWRHRNAVRFWDAHVGAGPRATPALAGGRVYALGATGILDVLDARDGSVVWSHDVAARLGSEPPAFGFVASPLIVGDMVVVHVGALAAFDAATGNERWVGEKVGSYSSPHLLSIEGVPQLLMLDSAGLSAYRPEDGSLLWRNAWPGIGILQPFQVEEGQLLFSQVENTAVPIGTRRIGVSRAPEGWSVQEGWTTNFLKPSFSAFVVHEGFAYGVDGRHLACVDLETGERVWKGGRYAAAQLLLLPDQDLLLVVSEQGELALVPAVPDGFDELASAPAIEGKSWSQPALVDDVLLVRTGEEMAAFRLAVAD